MRQRRSWCSVCRCSTWGTVRNGRCGGMWKRYVEEMIAFLPVLLHLLLHLLPLLLLHIYRLLLLLLTSSLLIPLTGSAKVPRSGASAVQRVEEEIPNGPLCSPPCPRGGQGKSPTTRVFTGTVHSSPLVAGGAGCGLTQSTHIYAYTYTHAHAHPDTVLVYLSLSLSF